MSVEQDQTVAFDLTDSNNDSFNTVIETKCEFVDDVDYPVHYYPADIFVSIMKAVISELDGVMFHVGNAGTIKTRLNGHDIILFPQIDTDGEEE